MSSQIACQNRCIVTLVAFEWLVSSVSFQMFSQIVWVNICEVALVAYERFFSRVSFQMSSHIACQNRCIVALVAFQWLFPVWVFKCFLKSSEWTYASHVGCIWTIFLKIEFSNVFSNWLSEQMHSCICTTFLHCEFQMCSQIVWVNRSKVALVASERFFPESVFKCLLKLPAKPDA